MFRFLCYDNWINEIDPDKVVEFIVPIDKGKVIKVYDGDTIFIASKLPYKKSPIYKFSVRLNGIDCPEIRTKNAEEKEYAIKAKEFVSNLTLNKVVTLKNLKNEKYGRILCDVYIDNKNLSELLLENKLAVKYNGGTKQIVNWKELYNS